MNPLKEIGDRIKRIRLELGLNQAKFAAKAGCKKGSISGYEKGDHEAKLTTLLRIAELGDVSINWLLTGGNICEKYIQEFTTEEEELISDFRKLNKAEKKFLKRVIHLLAR